MQNNSHSESKEHRLNRFKSGSPVEIIDTLLNSMANYFNNEISLTPEQNPPQTSLLFLGIHAAILTLAEAFFDNGYEKGYRLFLETFVDGDTEDTKFSNIANLIHNWRNILAHQWIGSLGHKVGYDYTMSYGYEVRGEVTFINPKIYCEHYLKVFKAGGKIWDYRRTLSDQEQENIKNRLIKKYEDR